MLATKSSGLSPPYRLQLVMARPEWPSTHQHDASTDPTGNAVVGCAGWGEQEGGASGFVNAHARFGRVSRLRYHGAEIPSRGPQPRSIQVLDEGRRNREQREPHPRAGLRSGIRGWALLGRRKSPAVAQADRHGQMHVWRGAGPRDRRTRTRVHVPAGHGYIFNAGIWVFVIDNSGIGAAAVQALFWAL